MTVFLVFYILNKNMRYKCYIDVSLKKQQQSFPISALLLFYGYITLSYFCYHVLFRIRKPHRTIKV